MKSLTPGNICCLDNFTFLLNHTDDVFPCIFCKHRLKNLRKYEEKSIDLHPSDVKCKPRNAEALCCARVKRGLNARYKIKAVKRQDIKASIDSS